MQQPQPLPAAQLAAKEKGAAAIAGTQALQKGLRILRRNVGSEIANQTTFILVGAALAGFARRAVHR